MQSEHDSSPKSLPAQKPMPITGTRSLTIAPNFASKVSEPERIANYSQENLERNLLGHSFALIGTWPTLLKTSFSTTEQDADSNTHDYEESHLGHDISRIDVHTYGKIQRQIDLTTEAIRERIAQIEELLSSSEITTEEILSLQGERDSLYTELRSRVQDTSPLDESSVGAQQENAGAGGTSGAVPDHGEGETGSQSGISKKLSEGDWYEYDLIHWATEIGNLANTSNSFVKAAVYNTQNNKASKYKTIAERSAYYDVVDALCAEGVLPRGIRFFGATSKVTSTNGIGAVENLGGWALHSKEAIAILKAINRILFEANMRIVRQLMNAKQITDPDKANPVRSISPLTFDLEMVEFEQNIVEKQFPVELEKIPVDKRGEAIQDINDDLNLKGFWRTLGEHTIVNTQPFEWAKTRLGKDQLDFTQFEHRVAMGKALVFSLHKCTLKEYLQYMSDGTFPQDNLKDDYRNPYSRGISPR